METSQKSQWKKAAAEIAAGLVENGMMVGLGTGSTAAEFVNALGRRVAEEDLRVTGIPTSEQTAAQARTLKIPLATFADCTRLDIAIDGADEVQPETLYLIKGHGGALLREKIVAAASKRLVIVADESKLVRDLGSRFSVPVEVVQFGWQVTASRLEQIGCKPELRLTSERKPFITDGGNYIVDCPFGPMANPKEIAHHLDHVVGSVEHGLFLGMASEVIVGGPDGVRTIKKTGS